MRVVLAHHWFVQPRGGERVLARFAQLFPAAPILTSVADPDVSAWPPELAGLRPRVRTTRLQSLYRVARRVPALLPALLPLMPAAWRHAFAAELSQADVLLVGDAGLAKTVAPPPGVKTFVYLYTPSRHLWYDARRYQERLSFGLRPLACLAAAYLRRQDRAASRRILSWAAISKTTAHRAAAAYELDPDSLRVIYPPVTLPACRPQAVPRQGLLVVSPLEPYKCDHLAVAAATALGVPLTVVGDGPCRAELQRLAGPRVRFAGFVSDHERNRLYEMSAGLLFCGAEDFGLVPAEAIGRGCPVLAYGRGGVTETVTENVNGLFFHEPTVTSVMEGIPRLLGRP